jgi:hypothetical protein
LQYYQLKRVGKKYLIRLFETSNLTAVSPNELRKYTSQKTKPNCNQRITQQAKKLKNAMLRLGRRWHGRMAELSCRP